MSLFYNKYFESFVLNDDGVSIALDLSYSQQLLLPSLIWRTESGDSCWCVISIFSSQLTRLEDCSLGSKATSKLAIIEPNINMHAVLTTYI